ncbi:hypothetical protein HG530_007707 [Fusarium avenaceum]|nr:hypothetical protein HG530_007707 [Fusarium avenaceum]
MSILSRELKSDKESAILFVDHDLSVTTAGIVGHARQFANWSRRGRGDMGSENIGVFSHVNFNNTLLGGGEFGVFIIGRDGKGFIHIGIGRCTNDNSRGFGNVFEVVGHILISIRLGCILSNRVINSDNNVVAIDRRLSSSRLMDSRVWVGGIGEVSNLGCSLGLKFHVIINGCFMCTILNRGSLSGISGSCLNSFGISDSSLGCGDIHCDISRFGFRKVGDLLGSLGLSHKGNLVVNKSLLDSDLGRSGIRGSGLSRSNLEDSGLFSSDVHRDINGFSVGKLRGLLNSLRLNQGRYIFIVGRFFNSVDSKGGVLSRNSLGNSVLSDSVLSGSVFNDSVLSGSVFSGSVFNDSVLSDSVLSGSVLSDDGLNSDGGLDRCRLGDSYLSRGSKWCIKK